MKDNHTENGRNRRSALPALILILALVLNVLPLGVMTPAALAEKPVPATDESGAPVPEAAPADAVFAAPAAEKGPTTEGFATAEGFAVELATPALMAELFGFEALGAELLQALVNPATLLGTQPLIFDPTPDNASSGDEVHVGWITFEIGTGTEFNLIQVTYLIDPAFRAQYDLQDVRTTINDTPPALVDSGLTALPELDEYTYVHTLALPVPLPAGVTSLRNCLKRSITGQTPKHDSNHCDVDHRFT